MSEEKTNEILLEIINIIDELRLAQEELRLARQELTNHNNSTNPHGLTNPNSRIYENIKNIVVRVLEEMAEDGKIKLVKDAE